MKKIFVYGTLKSHHSNFSLIKGGIFCGEGTLSSKNKMRMVSLGSFPALIPSGKDDSQNIVGEIWKIDDPTFKKVDFLEGYPSFYNRSKYKVLDSSSNTHECWVYFLPDKLSSSHISSVEGGVWT